MYKVLLVDDEADVRVGVRQEIDWESLGLAVVDTAENGFEAAEAVDRLLPDIVITDINMPFMNGLELAEWIKERYPATKIIILTGYDEFEYAQKAVKLHIDEYILKPFSTQELVEVMVKVKERMAEEARQKEDVEALREHYRKSLPVLREQFLVSIVDGKEAGKEIAPRCALYGLDFQGRAFIVSLIGMDRTEGLSEHSFQENEELKLFAILNIANEIVRKYDRGHVFLRRDHVAYLAVCPEEGLEEALRRTLSVAEEIRDCVERFTRLSVTVGVGTAHRRVEDMKISCEGAEHALDYRLLLGSGRVICIGDLEQPRSAKVSFDDMKLRAFVRCLKVGSAQEMNEMLDGLFAELAEADISLIDCQVCLLELITSLFSSAKDLNLNLDELLDMNASLNSFAGIPKFNHLQEAKQWVTEACAKIMAGIASRRQDTCSSLVEEAKDYVARHYNDSGISLQSLCKHLHISQGYFSTVFKREVRMTFVNYLLHVRMEEAKTLLRTTDLRTFEIAERVGYPEPNYFSFCFKKSVGVSPKEYRNQGNETTSA